MSAPSDHIPGRFRGWVVVIHNVRPEIYDDVRKYVFQDPPKEFAMSVEPYPDKPGYHLHLYLEYTNQRRFNPILHKFEGLSKKIQTPRPKGEKRAHGRVDVKMMKGTFLQATAYLRGETKDKPTGEVVTGRRKECHRRWRWTGCVGNSPLEEICSLCYSTQCLGCCPGCPDCDPTFVLFNPFVDHTGGRSCYPAGDRMIKYLQEKNEALRKKYHKYNNALRQKARNQEAVQEDLQEAVRPQESSSDDQTNSDEESGN